MQFCQFSLSPAPVLPIQLHETMKYHTNMYQIMQYHPIWQFVEKDHLLGKDEEVYKEKSCFNDMSQK